MTNTISAIAAANTIDAITVAFLESLIGDIKRGDVRITSMSAQRDDAAGASDQLALQRTADAVNVGGVDIVEEGTITLAWERVAPSAPSPALQPPPLAGQHVTRCACGGSLVDSNDGPICEDCGAA